MTEERMRDAPAPTPTSDDTERAYRTARAAQSLVEAIPGALASDEYQTDPAYRAKVREQITAARLALRDLAESPLVDATPGRISREHLDANLADLELEAAAVQSQVAELALERARRREYVVSSDELPGLVRLKGSTYTVCPEGARSGLYVDKPTDTQRKRVERLTDWLPELAEVIELVDDGGARTELLYRMRVGESEQTVSSATVTVKGDGWALFPQAAGVASRGVREAMGNYLLQQAHALTLTRARTQAGWMPGETLEYVYLDGSTSRGRRVPMHLPGLSEELADLTTPPARPVSDDAIRAALDFAGQVSPRKMYALLALGTGARSLLSTIRSAQSFDCRIGPKETGKTSTAAFGRALSLRWVAWPPVPTASFGSDAAGGIEGPADREADMATLFDDFQTSGGEAAVRELGEKLDRILRAAHNATPVRGRMARDGGARRSNRVRNIPDVTGEDAAPIATRDSLDRRGLLFWYAKGDVDMRLVAAGFSEHAPAYRELGERVIRSAQERGRAAMAEELERLDAKWRLECERALAVRRELVSQSVLKSAGTRLAGLELLARVVPGLEPETLARRALPALARHVDRQLEWMSDRETRFAPAWVLGGFLYRALTERRAHIAPQTGGPLAPCVPGRALTEQGLRRIGYGETYEGEGPPIFYLEDDHALGLELKTLTQLVARDPRLGSYGPRELLARLEESGAIRAAHTKDGDRTHMRVVDGRRIRVVIVPQTVVYEDPEPGGGGDTDGGEGRGGAPLSPDAPSDERASPEPPDPATLPLMLGDDAPAPRGDSVAAAQAPGSAGHFLSNNSGGGASDPPAAGYAAPTRAAAVPREWPEAYRTWAAETIEYARSQGMSEGEASARAIADIGAELARAESESADPREPVDDDGASELDEGVPVSDAPAPEREESATPGGAAPTRARSRGASRTASEMYANVATDGRRIIATDGATRELGTIADAGELAAAARALMPAAGQIIVWAHESAAGPLGLPSQMPGPFDADARGLRLAFAQRAAARGVVVLPRGENGWHIVQNAGAPDVLLAFAAYAGGDFAGTADAAELLAIAERFRAALGLAFAYSSQSTLRNLIRQRSRKIPASLPEPELSPEYIGTAWAIPASEWTRPLRESERAAGWVRAFDRSGSYLAAYNGCVLSDGGWTQRRDDRRLERPRGEYAMPPGYYRIALAPLARAISAAGLPDPFARAAATDSGEAWLTAPLAYLAAELAEEWGIELDVIRSYEPVDKCRALDLAGARLSAARTELLGDPSSVAARALGELKVGYSAVLGWLETVLRVPDPLARPHWARTVRERHVSNTWRALRAATPRPFAFSDIDTALFVLDAPDAAPAGMRIGHELGAWKSKGGALAIAEALELLAAGGPHAIVRRLEGDRG